MSAGSSAGAAEMTQMQRNAPVLPPLQFASYKKQDTSISQIYWRHWRRRQWTAICILRVTVFLP
ncbi:MAG: hypothetical protein ABI970_14630 [Chloroflexota bacterium]